MIMAYLISYPQFNIWNISYITPHKLQKQKENLHCGHHVYGENKTETRIKVILHEPIFNADF